MTATEATERLGYRIDELVKLLGVSRATVERRISDGTLRTTKKFGGTIITAASVEAALNNGLKKQRRRKQA